MAAEPPIIPVAHTAYAACAILGYAYLLTAALTSPPASRFIVGQSTTRPRPGSAPLHLPIVAFLWTVVTSSAFLVWRERVFRRAVAESGGDDDGPSGHPANDIYSFFHVGWTGHFVFLGVPVDNWVSYSLLVIYQITRGVIASLLEWIWSPFMSKMAAPSDCSEDDFHINARAIAQIQIGKALTTVSVTYSSFTNFVLTFTRIDLAIIGVLVHVLSDAVYINRSLLAKMNRASCAANPHERRHARDAPLPALLHRRRDEQGGSVDVKL